MCFCGTFVYLFRARRGRRLDRIRFVLLGVLRARDCGVRMSPAREPVALILCWNIQDFVFCWMQSCLGCNRAKLHPENGRRSDALCSAAQHTGMA